MSQNLQFGEQLPCGGYAEEDKLIKNNMKILSEQETSNQPQTKIVKNQSQSCCQQSCQKDCKQEQTKQANLCSKQSTSCNDCECSQKKAQQKIQQQKIDQTRKITKALCKKCKTQPSALIHKNEPICKECLLKNIQYKCRLTLQNSMKVTQKSKILICFSGGLNSICLVNVMSSLKKRYQKHHLFGQLRCIYIQQQQSTPEDYKQMFQKQTGINLQILKISHIFEGQDKSLSDVKEIFPMFNKSANTADLLSLFRDRLIVNYAREHNFEFIVKGLNGQSIAGSIFKYFTKGIGGDVTQLSSSQDDSLFHYPLRQHLQKQLQYYFYTLKCSKLSLIAHEDDLSNVCSTELDDHLDHFILSLQSMYSHTAPAITRTAQKIESNRKNQTRCHWCMFKGSAQPLGLCRKCQRMYQSKNKNFDNSKIPAWLRVIE